MSDLALAGEVVERRRVAFVLPNLRGGGAERVVVTLLRHLDRRRFQPHLILVDAVGPYLRELAADVAVHSLEARRVRHALLRLPRILTRLRPSVVVSTQGYMNFALLLARPLLPPTRLVVREVIGERYLEGSRFRTTYYRCYLRLVRRADRIVTQSDAAAGEMRARVRARPGQVIRLYNPVDAGEVARRGRTALSPFDRPGPNIVAAGRLSHQKGFDLLLEALAQAVATGVSGSLTVLGEGPDRAALMARAQALGLEAAVRFAGFQDNPYAYFANADVFVLSSRYEGLPNVVLEALACGCPVVAFDCPHGVREIIRHDVNGLLVPPEDVGGLRDALIRLLGSAAERARLRSQIAPTIAPFAVDEILRGWEALFDEVAPPISVARVA